MVRQGSTPLFSTASAPTCRSPRLQARRICSRRGTGHLINVACEHLSRTYKIERLDSLNRHPACGRRVLPAPYEVGKLLRHAREALERTLHFPVGAHEPRRHNANLGWRRRNSASTEYGVAVGYRVVVEYHQVLTPHSRRPALRPAATRGCCRALSGVPSERGVPPLRPYRRSSRCQPAPLRHWGRR